MSGQIGFWDVQDRLSQLSRHGNPLEKLSVTVDFEIFRAALAKAVNRGKGGRPPFDPVLKFKMLVLQALNGLSLEQTEFLVKDRLSWMRFCGLGPGDTVPDANTLWDFREALIAADALDALFARLDRAISDARWTVKFSKAKPAENGQKQHIDIAIPTFGYKNHILVDRRHGVIRKALVTDAAAHDGARLREGLIDPKNTASHVWADSAYRSAENERFLDKAGKASRIHRMKPKGKGSPGETECDWTVWLLSKVNGKLKVRYQSIRRQGFDPLVAFLMRR